MPGDLSLIQIGTFFQDYLQEVVSNLNLILSKFNSTKVVRVNSLVGLHFTLQTYSVVDMDPMVKVDTLCQRDLQWGVQVGAEAHIRCRFTL